MKITVLLLCAGILSVSAVGYSQDAKVSLQVRNKSVNEVLSAIKEQTSYSFWFDVKDVDVDRMVSLDVKNATVRMVLDHAFKDQDVDFVMYGNHIIIGKKGSFSHVQGQGIPISGMVTDENDDPMPGVNVMVKGTTTGVVTDINGRFSISAPGRESVIIFSFVGYEPKEMLVEDKTIINVQMAESAKELEEVVVIGYGQVRKKDLTGAVSQVKTEQFATQISTNVLDYLNGTVAGFNVNVGTSASGAADKDMEIRGPASLAANNTPLIVLDGVIFNGALNDINPLDIETIDVLKDASSAAVYGSRSAAGVIIISTKKGRSEKTSINFSVQLGITGFTKEMKPFGPDGYLKYRQDYLVRTNPGQPEAYYTNPNRLPSGIDVDTWQNYDVTPAADPIHTWMNRMQLQEVEKQNYMDNKSLDWYDAATRTGFRQNYDVSLSGGTEKLKYYWSLGYTDNKGRMKGDEYKTIRSRINADMRVTDFLNVGVNAQFSNKDMSNVALTLNNVILQSPLGQLYDESGLLKWYPHDDSGVSNPFLANEYRDKYHMVQNLFANFYADLKLPLGFSYRFNYINRFDWGKNYHYDPTTMISGSTSGGLGERVNTSLYEWQIDNIISWKKRFGVHDFYATFLYNAEKFQEWKDTGKSENFSPSEQLGYHQLKSGSSYALENDDKYSTGTAIMGRLNYTLMDRYLFTFSIRRDGYSAFGTNNPYAVFPSGAVAWVISEESFFNTSWINNLKVRASYGVNGNRDIGMYEALARLGTTKYLTNGTLISGIYSNTMANSDLKWEKTTAFNIGFDFSIFENRLSGVVDYYDMKTTDLLLERALPEIIGYEKVMSNMGELQNKGFELTLNSQNIRNERLVWNSTFLLSLNRNKIVHLYGEMMNVTDANGNVTGQREADDITNEWFIGKSIDRIWDYEFEGIYQLGEEEDAKSFGKAPGDAKLYDKDENGKSTQEDKTFQGYTKPRYRLGFRNDFTIFKNFQVSCFIRADLGHHGKNPMLTNTDHMGNRRNAYDVPYWTPENPSNKYTRINAVNNPAYHIYESRSFLRLQDLSVAYNLPETLIGRIGIQSCQVYFSSRNLLTISKWSGWDPESGWDSDNGHRPMPRIFTFGLNISL